MACGPLVLIIPRKQDLTLLHANYLQCSYYECTGWSWPWLSVYTLKDTCSYDKFIWSDRTTMWQAQSIQSKILILEFNFKGALCLGRFSAKVYDCLFALQHTIPLWKQIRSKFFSCRVDPFSEEDKKKFETWIVSQNMLKMSLPQ